LKRLITLLSISILMVSLMGCSLANTSVTLLSGNPWISSAILPSGESVKPFESEEIVPEPDDTTLVRVLDYIPEARQSLAYATADNFTEQRIYDFTDAYLRYGTVKKLAAACRELATLDLGILILDAFRPLKAQEALWEICPDETYVSHPKTGKRYHCRGNTVDVTLVDLRTGEAKPVPTDYDVFTEQADRDYTDCAPEGALYAVLLENIMKKNGFEPYFEEWWHFTDTDEYPIEETFHPSLPGTWVANCNKLISILKAPYSTSTIGRIYAGESMKLLGWNDKYARISYNGKTGYVMSSYIKPQDEDYFENCLSVVAPDATYSHDQMLEDIHALQTAYPDNLAVDSIGLSELGRDIPVLRIGHPDAEYHVLFQGAMHGREHMTAWLLMALADYWLYNDILSYGDICYHIIPMSNPDGVTISQEESLPDTLLKIYRNDIRLGYTNDRKSVYASLWKANGLGEDINRNFPDGWNSIYDRESPSSMNYPGKTPFSTAEARALRDYTLKYEFDATISYHATGSLIFYEYGKKRNINKLCKSLARSVQKVSGYTLMGSSETDGAGYKDWAIQSLEIPSLTIEVGCQLAPLEERELYSIFARNYKVLPAIADWLQP